MLSLIPFTTGWMGENNFEKNTVALYGINLLGAAIAFTVLEKLAVKLKGQNSIISQALKTKEIVAILLYVIGIALFFIPILSILCFVLAGILWAITDRRIETLITEQEKE